jgi:hypothetical protein
MQREGLQGRYDGRLTHKTHSAYTLSYRKRVLISLISYRRYATARPYPAYDRLEGAVITVDPHERDRISLAVKRWEGDAEPHHRVLACARSRSRM